MLTININEAQKRLLELVKQAKDGKRGGNAVVGQGWADDRACLSVFLVFPLSLLYAL